MRLAMRACILSAACACGRVAAIEPGATGVIGDASGLEDALPPFTDAEAFALVSADATDSSLDDASEAVVADTGSGEAAMRDGAACSTVPNPGGGPPVGGTLTAQANGSTVIFDQCGCELLVGGGPFYITCQTPGLDIYTHGPYPSPTKTSVSYYGPGGFLGDGIVHFTAFGAVGEFVDGTVSAPATGAVAFEGSFHLCRGPDVPWGGN